MDSSSSLFKFVQASVARVVSSSDLQCSCLVDRNEVSVQSFLILPHKLTHYNVAVILQRRCPGQMGFSARFVRRFYQAEGFSRWMTKNLTLLSQIGFCESGTVWLPVRLLHPWVSLELVFSDHPLITAPRGPLERKPVSRSPVTSKVFRKTLLVTGEVGYPIY